MGRLSFHHTSAMKRCFVRFGWPSLLLAIFLSACTEFFFGPDDHEDPTPDARLGKVAFETSCAGCHASGDAFDLAYFSFSDFDVVRRAVKHVDTTTANNIVAYVRSLQVNGVQEATRVFQPGTAVLASDQAFWRDLFGTDQFPEALTSSDLRAVNPRQVSVPVGLLTWSSEGTDLDWMSDDPLPSELLELDDGALDEAIASYREDRTELRLLDFIDVFTRVSTDSTLSASPLCEGEAATHTYPTPCFDARRWASSLAATHYLRRGNVASVPGAVAQLWWDTGEAAVTVWANERRTIEQRRIAAAWLYLAFSFAPEAFPERSGYLTQHLQTLGYPRLSSFVAMRRMVGNGRAQQTDDQPFWDAFLAISRAPNNLSLSVALFAYSYLRDRLTSGDSAMDPAFATHLIQQSWSLMESQGATSNADLRSAAIAVRDEVLQLLE